MTTDQIIDCTGSLLTKMGIPFENIDVKAEGDFQRVTITCDNPSRIIGWHGETLNAIQHLVKSMIRSQEKLDRAPFLVLDTDGYRLMQEDKVRAIAEKKIDFVRRTGARVTLQPMSPYFRRIVHTHIAGNDAYKDIATESIGEGSYRQVVLRLKDEKMPEGQELSPVMQSDDGEDDLGNLDV